LVLVNSFVLREEYRKKEITEEFIEMIYRDFYNDNTLIVAFVMPFQDYEVNADYYMNQKSVQVREKLRFFNDIKEVRASEYYSLDKFFRKEDKEMNEYKLFSVANKCGFSRIGESHLFKYSSNKTIDRILEKLKLSQNLIKKDEDTY
jgi:hypothetical protein